MALEAGGEGAAAREATGAGHSHPCAKLALQATPEGAWPCGAGAQPAEAAKVPCPRGPRGGSGKNWRSYEDATVFVRSLKLVGIKGWLEFCRTGNRPADIPSNPNLTYRGKGWVDWPHFIGEPPPRPAPLSCPPPPPPQSLLW